MEFDLEKMKNRTIHCNTKEKAEKLLQFLHEQGYKWQSGETLLYTNWSYIKENTCYKIREDTHIIRIFNINDMGYNKILEFEDIIIQDKPKICDIAGLGIGEKFNIKGYSYNPCIITQTGNIFDCEGKNPYTIFVLNIIQNPELIEKIPEYTDEQKAIFKALKVLGFNYIIRNNIGLIASTAKPNRLKSIGSWTVWDAGRRALIEDNEFDFISLKDEKPFEIPEI